MAIRKIGVLTSGGDAPGMNACVRAVVRAAGVNGMPVFGIMRGYVGLINGEIEELSARSVSNVLQRGGTVIKTGRSKEFFSEEGRATAAANLREKRIDALVAIGGDGTFRGAEKISAEHGINVIGIPGTIDNDVYGTDFTIGFDTAVNTALESIDRIRDTADAHERLFLVEVMGRHSGEIALAVAVGGGAEAVLVPEEDQDIEPLAKSLVEGREKGKTSTLVVIAEGDEEGGAVDVGRKLKDLTGIDFRVCVLGHTQRGGSPTAADRLLASRLGVAAVELLAEGATNVMVGLRNGEICTTPLSEVVTRKKDINRDILRIVDILAS
jgi:6-phosphofructokinase 1